ncbi:MAG: hypothetical protein C0392_01155 [Syntrophus sp. (in: bacteria)]|nr:hypothetical protein [Syntrophus sp. (in: bacteria)]
MSLTKYLHKKYVAVSFENDLMKIAYVQQDDKNLVVQRTRTVPDAEFDDFLKNTRDKEFIVVHSFYTMYQDIFLLPPAKDEYLKELARIEIEKHFTGVSGFSFFYSFLGTAENEGVKAKEIFVYAVNYDDLNPIIERFNRFDKTIIALYPSIVPLAGILESGALPDETLFCILDLGIQKTLFLVKNGKIRFVRVTQSENPGISAPDIDNINMTANYFRQTLRINPSKIVFVGTTDYPYESVSGLIAPVTTFQQPKDIIALPQVIDEYLLPISSVFFHRNAHWGNLLPASYQALWVQKKVVSLSVALFILLSLISIGSIAWRIPESSHLKRNIEGLKKDISRNEVVFHEFQSSHRELQRVVPFIIHMNKVNSAADMQKTLAALKFLPVENIRVDSVHIQMKEEKIVIRLQGIVTAKSYTDMDTCFSKLIEAIKSARDMEITTQTLDAKIKSFVVEVKWKS